MKDHLFVVVLRYLVPLDVLDTHRDAHLKYLDDGYGKGVFLLSGPQVPRNGGIIMARSKTREALLAVLSMDPFAIHKVAEYQVFEFTPTKHIAELSFLSALD